MLSPDPDPLKEKPPRERLNVPVPPVRKEAEYHIRVTPYEIELRLLTRITLEEKPLEEKPLESTSLSRYPL